MTGIGPGAADGDPAGAGADPGGAGGLGYWGGYSMPFYYGTTVSTEIVMGTISTATFMAVLCAAVASMTVGGGIHGGGGRGR